MSLAERLRKSRSKHTLKNYADAVKQLRVFKAAQPISGRRFVFSANTPKSEGSFYPAHTKNERIALGQSPSNNPSPT